MKNAESFFYAKSYILFMIGSLYLKLRESYTNQKEADIMAKWKRIFIVMLVVILTGVG